MSFRIATAGVGYIARLHAQAVRATPGTELTAVVNHRPESAAAFADEFGVPCVYGTVEELLTAGEVDALLVNTPNALHAAQTIAALRAGVAVMVEKPMAMNAAEAEAMVAAAKQSGATLMVAHCWRFEAEARWLRAQVVAGRLGRVIRTKGYGVHVAWGPQGWFTDQALAGGGALADMGIHAIDTARYLLGDPRPLSVYARISTEYGGYAVDDTGVLIVNWDGGVSSYIESGWWQPHADGWCASTQLYGTGGFGQLYPTQLNLMQLNPTRREAVDSGFPAQAQYGAPQQMYDAQLAHFVACAQTGAPPEAGGEVGLTNMRIVDAAYASARTGQVVMLAQSEPISG
jgi:predicted dehydrogenase